MRLMEFDVRTRNDIFGKYTPSIEQLAQKYKMSIITVSMKVAEGIMVELEHTNDYTIAAEIACDHLNEDIDYYTKLATIEKD